MELLDDNFNQISRRKLLSIDCRAKIKYLHAWTLFLTCHIETAITRYDKLEENFTIKNYLKSKEMRQFVTNGINLCYIKFN